MYGSIETVLLLIVFRIIVMLRSTKIWQEILIGPSGVSYLLGPEVVLVSRSTHPGAIVGSAGS